MDQDWNEPSFETLGHISALELRLGEAWVHRAEGRPGPARSLVQGLKQEVSSLPRRHRHLVAEIEILEQSLASPGEHQEVRRLLADAERNSHGGRPSLSAQLLGEAGRRLSRLPAEGAADLHEEYQRLQTLFQDLRRSALDRFRVLMESFTRTLEAKVADVRALSRTNRPLPQELLRNLLDQVLLAQGVLASLDPFLIGCRDHEGAAGRIRMLREILLDHLKRGAAAAPPTSPERPAEPAWPSTDSAPDARPGWELSDWAKGEWQAKSGTGRR